jgi:BirA family biotin operon repressor/biotin-[acetyl-CoA-carboxylase] ligase
MKLIKLNAIDSTNDFLKGLSGKGSVENFTVVVAEDQTKGKGQMGAQWVSESGKNLTMSVLIKDLLSDINHIFSLNALVALSITSALREWNIPNLTIKWPNDIMSDNKKIGGILIENSIKAEGAIISIVGIGLNVNQTQFDLLPKATSLSNLTGVLHDKEQLLLSIVSHLETNVGKFNSNSFLNLWESYNTMLFKKEIPMPFQSIDGKRFMGIIKGVDILGRLSILLEDDTLVSFEIKQIQMLY